MAAQNASSGGDTASGAKKQPKLRSTCDACISAKIRCSRDTPQCFRCQTYNTNCVYSLSRKMGRPRKRRLSSQNEQENQDKAVDRSDTLKECSRPWKRTVKGHWKHPSTSPEIRHNYPTASPQARVVTTADTPSFITNGDFTVPVDYSLHTVDPRIQDIVMNDMGQTQSCVKLFSPLDTSCNTMFQEDTLKKLSQVPNNPPTSATTISNHLPVWDDSTSPNMFNPDPDSSIFTNFHDLEQIDFSISSASEDSPKTENNLSLNPTIPDPETQTSFPYPPNPTNTNPSHPFQPPAPQTSHCDCYKKTLHHLLSLEEPLSNNRPTTLDTARRLSHDILSHTENFLQCTICAGKHPNHHILLLAILLDNLVGALETTPSPSNAHRTPSQPSSHNPKHPNNNNTINAAQHRNPARFPLGASVFDLVQEENYNPPNQSWHATHLLHLVRSLEKLQKKAAQSVKRDTSAKMAETMLLETGARLRSLMKRLEL